MICHVQCTLLYYLGHVHRLHFGENRSLGDIGDSRDSKYGHEKPLKSTINPVSRQGSLQKQSISCVLNPFLGYGFIDKLPL